MQPISHIAPQKVTRSQFVTDYNYLTRANYLYLRKCVENYARLLGKKHNHNPGNSWGAGIANLYVELKCLVGESISVNIHINDKRLVFVLWDTYAWGEYNVYWIPLTFVEALPVPLRRLTISFLYHFRKSMQLDTTNSSCDIEFILDWQYETLDDYEDDKERKDFLKYLSAYKEGGKVYKLMERIETKCYHKDLPKALNEYKPGSDSEKKLVDIMKEGLRFTADNTPTIFQYAYDVYEDEDSDNDPVKLDQMIRFIYKDDTVIENLSQYIDDCYNNYYSIRPCATLVLTPEGKELFGKEAFPEEFLTYLDKLNDFARGY